jgi:Zinc-finger of C2H2 type
MPIFYIDNSGCRQRNATGVNKAAIQDKAQSYHYCANCDRSFMSANNLDVHRRSATHQPKDVDCPSKGCAQAFVSLSALILHLEFGRCRSGINLAGITEYVRRRDTKHFITDHTLNAADDIETTVYKSWNGTAHECYLCHLLFRKRQSLIQHLRSPRHLTKIYMCPQSTCREHFSALSGLCQHVESGKCGAQQKRKVLGFISRLISQMVKMTK